MRRYIELVKPLATEAQLSETQRLAKVLRSPLRPPFGQASTLPAL